MPYPKVTVVGAGQVGATAAQLLVLHQIADVVMIDVAEGLPQGKALDMMHMRSVERFGPTVSGTNDYADTAGSDVVVVTAGLPRKPGMTRDDLLAANKAIVESVIAQVVAASPDAIIVCVTNPLDVMTYLAKNVSGLPTNRVFGMGGVLDSARFAYAIAEKTGAPIDTIDALAIGAHGDAMVPMPRFSTVAGRLAAPDPLGDRGRPSSWTGPSSAGRRSSRCSRPARRSTRRPQASSRWCAPFSATPGRRCPRAPTCPASTASPTSTSACRPVSAAQACSRSSSCR